MRPRLITAENTRCFNEAAADDRGKRRRVPGGPAGRLDASMRPRPMTAENATHEPILPGGGWLQ